MSFQVEKTDPSVSTYFAPFERADATAILEEISFLSKNPIIDTILSNVSGFFAVCNQERQIVAINDTFLTMLGVDNIGSLLGMRLGEVIKCVHAHEQPNGCGTTPYCITCGAAIATVTSLVQDKMVESECVATVHWNGATKDIYLQIKCCPIVFVDTKFILMFLRDETINQQRAILERSFLHDITNTIAALNMNAEFLEKENNPDVIQETIDQIGHLTRMLTKEVQIQHLLTNIAPSSIQLSRQTLPIASVTHMLDQIVYRHPSAEGKRIVYPQGLPEQNITTDITLLLRVLQNMVINALEAAESGQVVEIWTEVTNSSITFFVWNQQFIPPDIALRIFQRNYTTKGGDGRGLGTYVMKLLGETYLNGKVGFSSQPESGTTFHVWLPVNPTETTT